MLPPRRIYVQSPTRADIRVPMREVLGVKLYDTRGPHADGVRELPRLRAEWIKHNGRRTQLQCARDGMITPEMEFVALRENQRRLDVAEDWRSKYGVDAEREARLRGTSEPERVLA